MATLFKKLHAPQLPKLKDEEVSKDSIYWKNLEFPVTIKHSGAVSRVEFNPVHPYNYLVTSSTKVQIYSSQTKKPLKSLTRFEKLAYSGSYRSDGQLIVAGSEDGLIRLIIPDKDIWQRFEGHQGPVHLAKFADNHRIFSGSDDKTVRIWDLATKAEVSCYSENTDYVRCGSTGNATDLIATGSYDHTVKLFDPRTAKSILTIDHGDVVDSVLMYPGGGMCASAGGNIIKVWDLLSGGKLMASMSNHHKTITDLCFCSSSQRLVSSSLDRHVKFYDITTYKVVHSLDYPGSILSLAVSPDDSLVAVGMVDGMLSVRHRKTDAEVEAEKEKKRKQKKRNAMFNQTSSGQSLAHDKEEFMIEHKRKEHLEKYDRFFKQFKYSKALDAAMELNLRTRSPEMTIAVIQELRRREGLRAALAGRSDKSLTVLLTFLLKNFCPPYIQIVMDTLFLILELYEDSMDDLTSAFAVLVKLKQAVDDRVQFTMDSLETVGVIKTILASSALRSSNEPGSNSVVEQKSIDDELLGN